MNMRYMYRHLWSAEPPSTGSRADNRPAYFSSATKSPFTTNAYVMYLGLFHKSMCMTGRSYSSSPPLRDKIFLSTILACCFKFVKSLRVLQFCGKHVMSRDII